jgi:hypothetical protein
MLGAKEVSKEIWVVPSQFQAEEEVEEGSPQAANQI